MNTIIKFNKNILTVVCCVLLMTSCNDYLGFDYPGSTLATDAFNTFENAEQAVTAAYVPLQWEYGFGTFFFEWWFGDVCSDDALKGGESLNAMPDAYDLENFRIRTDNDILRIFYRAQYQGAFRANFALENTSEMDPALFTAGMQDRLIGEALFLRAMYHFRLVRVFGGVPIADRAIYVQSEWKQPRASQAEVYTFIISDLEQAIKLLPTQNRYAAKDIGRASKGAARALLMKVYMNTGQFDGAKALAQDIFSDPTGYTLHADYNRNFNFEFDNSGKESLFEIQYLDNGRGDWGDPYTGGLGATRATWTTVFTRPRWADVQKNDEGKPTQGPGSGSGWGWSRPTQELYDEFEEGDMRRDATIINPSFERVSDDGPTATTMNTYLGNRYHSRKYAEMNPDTTFYPLDGNPRGTINRKEIRYSDVLLMYAEACLKASSPDMGQAKWALEQVRARAREFSGGGSVLPSFPNYTIPLRVVGENGNKQLADNAEDLMLAIKHERRVELGMEGHRWFDLKRWDMLDKVMNHYRVTAQPQIGELMNPFVKGRNELFPIPKQEIDMNPMEQNPGY